MALSAEETGVEIGATQPADGLPPHEVELADVAAVGSPVGAAWVPQPASAAPAISATSAARRRLPRTRRRPPPRRRRPTTSPSRRSATGWTPGGT